MIVRRLSTVLVMGCALTAAGVETRPPAQPADPKPDGPKATAPPPGWVRDRLATVDKKLEADIKDLVALYQHALAMTCVSTCGPESLPTLEAFALGCPVLNTDVPGVEEQFGEAALIVPSTDRARIAGAILTLHGDAARREAMIAAGRVIAAERTPGNFARRLLEAVAPFAQKRKNWSARHHYVRPLRLGRIFGR